MPVAGRAEAQDAVGGERVFVANGGRRRAQCGPFGGGPHCDLPSRGERQAGQPGEHQRTEQQGRKEPARRLRRGQRQHRGRQGLRPRGRAQGDRPREQVRRHGDRRQRGAGQCRRRQPALREPRGQPLPAALQPPLHRAVGPAQLPGRLLARQPLDTAEQHCQTVLFRQPGQFLIDDAHQFPAAGLRHRIARGRGRQGLGRLALDPPRVPGPCLARLAQRHRVQPVRQRRLAPEPLRGPCERKERRLEDVVGLLAIDQLPARHAQDRPAVASHHLREGVLIPALGVPGEQFGVGGGTADQRLEIADHARLFCTGPHGATS